MGLFDMFDFNHDGKVSEFEKFAGFTAINLPGAVEHAVDANMDTLDDLYNSDSDSSDGSDNLSDPLFSDDYGLKEAMDSAGVSGYDLANMDKNELRDTLDTSSLDLQEKLEMSGIDIDEFSEMDSIDRMTALEDAGIDSFDF